MVDIYADEGITGTSATKRPEFLRMIRQCRQKKIDRVLTKSISRAMEQAAEQMDGQDHMAEFQAITNEIAALKDQRTYLEAQRTSNAAVVQRMNMAVSLLTESSPELKEWDDPTIRQLVDTVKVISADEIEVYLQGGIKITQEITK